jgi:hypothetical protein
MQVALVNLKTGELKQVKIGWSWTLFFFSGVFGLPLFLRKLHVWGFVFLALWIVNLLGPFIAGDGAVGVSSLMFFVLAGLEIWIAIKGNEMTAKNLLELGWSFADPLSEAARYARAKWGLAAELGSPLHA